MTSVPLILLVLALAYALCLSFTWGLCRMAAASDRTVASMIAPATWCGWQHCHPLDQPPLGLWTLRVAVGEYPAGTTLTTVTLRQLGFDVQEPRENNEPWPD